MAISLEGILGLLGGIKFMSNNHIALTLRKSAIVAIVSTVGVWGYTFLSHGHMISLAPTLFFAACSFLVMCGLLTLWAYVEEKFS